MMIDATHDDQELDAIFGALSDTSRRRILQMLRQAGRLRVGDIAAAFEMSLNAVSKHLKTLEKAGLVERTIEGREHWIAPCPARLSVALRFFHLIEHLWHERLDSLAAQLEKRTPITSNEKEKPND
jgi:DNA-binding transcriptional ArsR family regulator